MVRDDLEQQPHVHLLQAREERQLELDFVLIGSDVRRKPPLAVVEQERPGIASPFVGAELAFRTPGRRPPAQLESVEDHPDGLTHGCGDQPAAEVVVQRGGQSLSGHSDRAVLQGDVHFLLEPLALCLARQVHGQHHRLARVIQVPHKTRVVRQSSL